MEEKVTPRNKKSNIPYNLIGQSLSLNQRIKSDNAKNHKN